MEKDNDNKVIKILIGVVVILSTIILLSGVFYILNMQKKIIKLEEKQKEQFKPQIEKSVPTTEVVQPQTNNETKEQIQQATNSKVSSQKSKKNSSKKQTIN
ncbi:OadG family protein [Leptotrichia sp. HSP-342]|uniref:OadG family protein n=1 Tax=Leptotrichia mesophila TaxID=3239303 RepID=A0AB39VBF2_9FUSO